MTFSGSLLIAALSAYFGVDQADRPMAVRALRGTPHATPRAVAARWSAAFIICPASIDRRQSWRRYAVKILIFNAALLLLTYAVLRLQAGLPLDPARLCG